MSLLFSFNFAFSFALSLLFNLGRFTTTIMRFLDFSFFFSNKFQNNLVAAEQVVYCTCINISEQWCDHSHFARQCPVERKHHILGILS